ncbi:peptidase M3 family protein [Metarhizium robertsii]|uniref:Peptidase family M3 n=2 Tax=Metarhizium robertsii TaxID=568076 RepID=E9F2A7_METRA|nr:peptidase family M3 [Metarhizium robertsii ARSEF 23]EFY98196.1 peptidase family M3 [Metarhizium robertsii ARSEF 23]EXV01574.1 peptidase M3 family protein [Metarhizium robertsii]
MAGAQYQNPPQAPPLFTGTTESVVADINKNNELTKSILDKVVADVKPENAIFDSVLEPGLVNENELGRSYRVAQFYQYVSASKELREASTKAQEISDEFNIELKMREDIFKLVDAAFETRDSQKLDGESLHLLQKERQKYIRNGLLLPAGPQRDRFKEIQKRLSLLCLQSQKNLNDEMGGVWFTPEQLEGVPSDDIDISGLEKGTGENEGKVKVTFKYNHFFPMSKYAIHEDTRRTYVIAESNKVNNNVPLFREIIALRDEAARMLGFPDHASLVISEKMAKTSGRVMEFLGDLRERLAPGGVKEADRLLQYKKEDCEARGAPFDGNLYMWDIPFYSRIMKEKEYSVDEAEISQYFPVDSTYQGMIKIFEQIFGFVFVELSKEDRARLSPTGKAEDMTWHEDVIVYSVWDDEAAGSGFCGYLYLDLHPRDNKYGHNANFNIEPGYLNKDGTRNYPATALVCNFSKPSATKPGLLKHHEVVTLFHELGHGIHDLAARTKYSYFHGTSVAGDFVEAPSQMLENWCWTPSVLKFLSRRWDTNEKIPDDMIEKLVKTKHFNSATSNLTQLLYGLFDMTVHTPKSHEEAKNMPIARVWNEFRRDITGIKGPEAQGQGLEWGNRFATIGHYTGGYDAGYYGYLYSQVFSLDMFHSFFKKDPMDGKEGRRYRKLVLGRGGSQEELQTLKDFLGREPNTEAFYQELGLA